MRELAWYPAWSSSDSSRLKTSMSISDPAATIKSDSGAVTALTGTERSRHAYDSSPFGPLPITVCPAFGPATRIPINGASEVADR